METKKSTRVLSILLAIMMVVSMIPNMAFAKEDTGDDAPTNNVEHLISASPSGGGTIQPGGVVTVKDGENKTFTATPYEGWTFDYFDVDGQNVYSSSYTFENVTDDHHIEAVFKKDMSETPADEPGNISYSIYASMGPGGLITPCDIVNVAEGQKKIFIATPYGGWTFDHFVVDSDQIFGSNTYTFNNVTGDHSITAIFKEKEPEPTTGTFAELQSLIDKAQTGDTITLDKDYVCQESEQGNAPISIGKAITIDLNGHTIDRGLKGKDAIDDGNVITVTGDGNLTIQDTNTENKVGTITGGNNSDNGNTYGGGIYIYRNGSLTMTGGSITGNSAEYSGGGICNNGTVIMNGGSITGNSAECYGAGIENSGTVTMTGGSITGNTVGNATYNSGCGAGIDHYKTDLNVGGTAVIKDNKSVTDAAGNTKDDNVYLWNNNNRIINILTDTDKAPQQGMEIGVTTRETPTVGTPKMIVAGESNTKYAKYFFADDSSKYAIMTKEDDSDPGIYLEKTLGPWEILQGKIAEGGPVELTNDVTCNDQDSGPLVVPNGATVTLDLKGHTIDRGLNKEDITPQNNGNVITVQSGGNLKIQDTNTENKVGTITGGNNSGKGGGIYNEGTVTMTGGSITCNSAHNDGGGIYSKGQYATITMTEGSITGNKTTGNGGGICNNGTVTMTGGSITGNETTSHGGGIYNYDGGTVTMSGDASITGNKTTGHGGGICNWSGTVTMTGGSITDNSAEYNGGGICNYNNAEISGDVSITGNHALYGGGIYTSGSTFTMSGGSITDNSANNGGGILNYNNVEISGNVSITGNTATGGTDWSGEFKPGYAGGIQHGGNGFKVGGTVKIKDNKSIVDENENTIDDNVYLYNNKTINILTDTDKAPQQGMEIGVTTATPPEEETPVTVVTGGAQYKENGYFTSDNEAYEVAVSEDEKDLVLKLVPTPTFAELQNLIDGATEGATIKLDKDYVCTNTEGDNAPISIGKAITIDLNGYTIDRGLKDKTAQGNGSVITVYEGANLTITDTNEEGKVGQITGGNNIDYSTVGTGGGISNYGDINLTGGSITGNSCNQFGGGILNEGTVTMTGGSITGNSSIYGGGIFNFGDVTISGNASITNNTATGYAYDDAPGLGGGIYNYGDFTMTGGSITDNKATGYYDEETEEYTPGLGGGIADNQWLEVGGTAVVKDNESVVDELGTTKADNVILAEGKTIAIADEKPTTGMNIGITTEETPGTADTPVPIVTGGAQYKKYFTSDNASCFLAKDKDRGDLLLKLKGEAPNPPSETETTFSALQSWIDATINAGLDKIELNQNYIFNSGDSPITIDDDIIIDLNGHTINRNLTSGNVITVGTYGDLTINDSSNPNTGKITGGNSGSNGGGIINKGTVTITGGSITGNSANSGGGIYNEGTVTMTGGSITGNSANSGGGIYINLDGSLTMTGGSITGNSAGDGGGIFSEGTVTMTGGSITGNTAENAGSPGRGGGIFNWQILNVGGTAVIKDNKSVTDAAGNTKDDNVYLCGGIIGIAGTTPKEGMSIGVTMEDTPTVGNPKMIVAEKSNIKYAKYFFADDSSKYAIMTKEDYPAPGIYLEKKLGPWEILQGKIAEGGLVELTNDVTCNDQDSGPLVVPEGKTVTLDLKGHTINRNLTSATANGNVITVQSGGDLTINDSSNPNTGKITGGNTTGLGGGIANYGTVTMTGGSITGNSADSYGGGIYIDQNRSLTMTGGSITGNSAECYGAGIENSGTVTMTGGSITGNTVGNATYNSGCGAGIDHWGTALNVGGTAVIKDNKSVTDAAGNTKDDNVYLCGRTIGIAGTTPEEGMSIGVTMENTPTVGNPKMIVEGKSNIEYAGYFFADDSSKYAIMTKEDGPNPGIYLEKKLSPWEILQGKIAEGGLVELTNDVTCNDQDSGPLVVPEGKTVTLDLKGYTIDRGLKGKEATLNGNVITVQSGANLTITDTNEEDKVGTITGGNGTDNGGGIYNLGTVTMTGGSITGNSAVYCGGICNEGTVTMTGGSITGNSAQINGGIRNNGSLTMTGGSITDNSAMSTVGGICHGGKDFYVGGTAVIKDNKSGTGTSEKADNVCLLNDENTINILTEQGKTPADGMSIGVTVYEIQKKTDPVTVVTGGAKYKKYFTSDDKDYFLAKDNSGDLLLKKKGEVPTPPSETKTTFSDLQSWIDATINAGLDKIELNQNYIFNSGDSPITIDDDIIIDLNGHTINRNLKSATTNGNVITVGTYGDLTIQNSQGDGTITGGNSGSNGGGIINKGTVTITGGSITGNSACHGGGIYNQGTVTITGGSITNNTATDIGGGIDNVRNATVTITGGSITGNSATNGSGGIDNGGTVTMTGGSITGNSASSGGGIINKGTVNMTGGSITGNSATSSGGGINTIGTVKVGGKAVVENNKSGTGESIKADNIYLYSPQTSIEVLVDSAPQQGMEIGVTTATSPTEDTPVPIVTGGASYKDKFSSDNDAYEVAVSGDNLVLKLVPTPTFADLQSLIDKAQTGATIKLDKDYVCTNTEGDNAPISIEKTITIDLNGHTIDRGLTSPIDHGNVITVGEDGNLTIQDTNTEQKVGTITGGYNNGEFTSGGGIHNRGTVTIAGGNITGNSSIAYGGGICNQGIVTITEGNITGNSALYGGGIFNDGKDEFVAAITITGGSINDNSAQIGGGIGNTGIIEMTGGSITDNKATGYYDEDTEEYTPGLGGGIANDLTLKLGGTAVVKDNESVVNKDGNTIVDNVYLSSGTKIEVLTGEGKTPQSEMEIGVTAQEPSDNLIIAVGDAEYKNKFTSDDPNCYVGVCVDSEGKNYICLKNDGKIVFQDNVQYRIDAAEVTVVGYTKDLGKNIEIPLQLTVGELTYFVGKIEDAAFAGCENLESVIIPESISEIGGSAFKDCKNLKTVTFKENSVLERMWGKVFYGCEKLESIKIPSKCLWICDHTFYNCKKLSSVEMVNGALCYIGEGAFEGCEILASLTIPASVNEIYPRAFANCKKLADVKLYNAGTFNHMGDTNYDIFEGSNLAINLIGYGDAICKIDGTTTECSLEDYIKETNEKRPEQSAIDFTSLSIVDDLGIKYIVNESDNTATIVGYTNKFASESGDITIPKEITTDKGKTYKVIAVADLAFRDCTRLISIKFAEDSELYSIGKEAFYNCYSMDSIEISKNITEIGLGAFKDTKAKVTVKEDNRNYSSDNNGILYNKEKTTLVAYPSAEGTISNIPASVKVIGPEAFFRTPITSIEIPEGVEEIGEGAFEICMYLGEAVVIPESVDTIGKNAFSSCEKMKQITIKSKELTIGNSDYDIFIGCADLETIKAYPTAEWTVEGESESFTPERYINKVAEKCPGLDIHFDSITKEEVIDDVKYEIDTEKGTAVVMQAAESFTGGDIEIPSEVSYEGSEVNYPVVAIGENAFKDCDNLESVKIPTSVKLIDHYAFGGSGLTEVIFEEGSELETIGRTAFYQCENLNTITIPKSVKVIMESAFNASGLETVTFEDGSQLEQIWDKVFKGCKNLDTVTIKSKEFTMGTDVFDDSGLQKIRGYDDAYCILNKGQGARVLLSTYANDIGANFEPLIVKVTDANNVDYEINTEKGTAIITGHEDGFAGENIVIPPEVSYGYPAVNYPVVAIGENAFAGCESLKSVEIPETVENIGCGAFAHCTALEEVTIKGVSVKIGDSDYNVFVGDNSLKTLKAHDGEAYCIVDGEKVSFETYAENIGIDFEPLGTVEDEVIYDFDEEGGAIVTGYESKPGEELKVVIEDTVEEHTVTAIGENAFADSNLTEITIYARNLTIGNGAFEGTALKKFRAINNTTYTYEITNAEEKTPEEFFNDMIQQGDFIPLYEIISSATKGGKINQEGESSYPQGIVEGENDLTFTATPDSGYKFDHFVVDGNAKEKANPYTFENVKTDHTIEAVFKSEPGPGPGPGPETEYTIKASATEGGTISPDGDVVAKEGSNKTFVATADETHDLAYFEVDGEQVTGSDKYTFTNVQENHTIKAVFVEKGEKVLESIEIEKLPFKVKYAIGDEFDPTGLRVLANYTDETKELVEDYTLSGFDSETAGEKTITVTYQDKTATFTVEVIGEKVIDHIEVEAMPVKVEYQLNEAFDPTGLKIAAIYSDETKELVEDYTLSGFDSETAGEKTITVTYQDKTTEFKVIVKDEPIPTQDGWVDNQDGTWSYKENGELVKGAWKNNIPGWDCWFYFDENGIMLTGWKDNIPGWVGTWFYFNSNGSMATGWKNDIPGYEGQWFYFNTNGTMATGWITGISGYEGKWFYFNANGTMATGWITGISGYEGEWFYFNTDGTMATGWIHLDAWYCLADNGVMYKNCITPDGYRVDENGRYVK